MTGPDPTAAGPDETPTAADARPSNLLRRALGRRTRSGRPLWLALAAGLGVLLVVVLILRQQTEQKASLDSPDSPAGLVMPEQGAGTSLAAVGRLVGLDRPCTAWLVAAGPEAPGDSATASQTDEPAGAATGAQPSASTAADAGSSEGQVGIGSRSGTAGGTAYAVTTGQCVGIRDSVTVLHNKPLSGVKVGFSAFARLSSAAEETILEVPVTGVAWGSARWVDLAILRLGASYDELLASGVSAIPAVASPPEGTELLVAGVPVAGLPAAEQYVRAGRCQLGSTTEVLEASWVWTDAMASNCKGILAGSAGSPVFNPAGEAVAMVNTTTIGAPATEACGLGSPCEVSPDGVGRKAHTTYLQAVSGVAACLASGQFRLGGQCPLEDPRGAVPARAERTSAMPGTSVLVTLAEKYRGRIADKVGPLPDVDCTAPAGWGQPVPAGEWHMRIKVPAQAGWVLGCVGSPEQATPVVVQVDTTAPDPRGVTLQTKDVKGGRQVAPVLDPPEYSGFLWTSGRTGQIDCATAEGFMEYRGVPATIQADDLPATVCLIAVDEAGNRSEPVAREAK